MRLFSNSSGEDIRNEILKKFPDSYEKLIVERYLQSLAGERDLVLEEKIVSANILYFGEIENN